MSKINKNLILTFLVICIPSFCYAQKDPVNTSIHDYTIDDINTLVNDNKVRIKELEKKIESSDKSITSLEHLVETGDKGLLEQITNTRNEITQKVDNIFSGQSMLKEELESLSSKQNELRRLILKYNDDLKSVSDSFKTKHTALINEVNDLTRNTESGIVTIQKDIFIKSFIGGLLIVTTFLIIIVLTVFAKRKFKKVNIVEEGIKLDAQMGEIIENQLVLMKKKSAEKGGGKSAEGIDHSLPISVGNEIFRMRKRISNMDESAKGISALKNALTRLEDEFNQQGYTINDLTGKPYTDELIVKVLNTFESDDLEPGARVISGMINPHILYKGEVVGHGEVDITISSKNIKQS